jgi:hypothetical protein
LISLSGLAAPDSPSDGDVAAAGVGAEAAPDDGLVFVNAVSHTGTLRKFGNDVGDDDGEGNEDGWVGVAAIWPVFTRDDPLLVGWMAVLAPWIVFTWDDPLLVGWMVVLAPWIVFTWDDWPLVGWVDDVTPWSVFTRDDSLLFDWVDVAAPRHVLVSGEWFNSVEGASSSVLITASVPAVWEQDEARAEGCWASSVRTLASPWASVLSAIARDTRAKVDFVVGHVTPFLARFPQMSKFTSTHQQLIPSGSHKRM